jgi:hypothetical protein
LFGGASHDVLGLLNHEIPLSILFSSPGVSDLKVTSFIAKIGLQNTPSITLFNSLGFTQESISEVFQEVTLKFVVTDAFTEGFPAYSRDVYERTGN